MELRTVSAWCGGSARLALLAHSGLRCYQVIDMHVTVFHLDLNEWLLSREVIIEIEL